MPTGTFELKFNTANDSFENLEAETAKVLADIRKRVLRGETAGNVRDSNGNTIGNWKLK